MGSLQGLHVVLVARNRRTRDLLCAVLEYCGALVTRTESADHALSVLRHIQATALVVELAGAEEEAFGLIARIRAAPFGRHGGIRAVALVDEEGGVSLKGVLEQGFDSCLSKPLDPWVLCRTLAELSAFNGRPC